jgi:hypothetical protein
MKPAGRGRTQQPAETKIVMALSLDERGRRFAQAVRGLFA